MTNALKWFERAQYDLDTAKSLLKEMRLLYVMFMCQQAVEKALKAYYLDKLSIQPPYIHNLNRIAKEVDLVNELDTADINFLDDLNSYYISSRYPDEIDEITNLCTVEKCNQTINTSEKLLSWLNNKMKY
jgi:HEPN domain-containing protein